MKNKLMDIVHDARMNALWHNAPNQSEYITDMLIANGVTVQRWIPVTERLPEESGQYIVCCNDSGCSYGEGIWYQSGVVVCAEVDFGIMGGICWEWVEGSATYDLDGIVTHWMPLPEPPKKV